MTFKSYFTNVLFLFIKQGYRMADPYQILTRNLNLSQHDLEP
jgi:hypothetical protein